MKRLYRSRNNAMLGGVCAGVAEYFAVDPTVVRLVWAACTLLAGTGVLAYIVAWLIVPQAPSGLDDRSAPAPAAGPATAPGAPSTRRSELSGPAILGLVLIGAGALSLARHFIPRFNTNLLWALALVGVGVYLLVDATRGDRS